MANKGTDLARAAGAAEHADAIEAMLQQLLIVLIKRAGGTVNIPVAEIDDTGHDMLAMQLLPDGQTFSFSVQRKS